MKKNYTHISVLLDRTGSMYAIRDDTIGGFNTFLEDQKKQPGSATLTLVQFDSEDPYEVIHHFKPIKKVPELTSETFVPRARTPLLDAFGRGITDLEKSLAELKKKDKPSCVIFVVITDGQENASREFKKDQIKRMIKEKTDKDSWQFLFLSADLDSIQDAMNLGVAQSSTLAYSLDSAGVSQGYSIMSLNVSDLRSGKIKKVNLPQNK